MKRIELPWRTRKVIQRLRIDTQLRFGDLLTVTTILISLITVLVSWRADRSLSITKDANEIRATASKALGEIQRWESISLSVHASAQVSFIEAAELIATSSPKAGTGRNTVQARDLLWKKLNDLYAQRSKRITDERIDGGYVGLLSFFPEVRKLYLDTLTDLNSLSLEMQAELLARSEATLLSFEQRTGPIQSAEIGNALRAVSAEIQLKYEARFKKQRLACDAFLLDKITANDDDLLAKSKATRY